MVNYRRLISYIYAYEGGVKGRNIGFAKIETRGGQCKIQVNVRNIYVGSQDIGVYLLAGSDEIFLGGMFVRGGAGEFRTAVPFGNVAGSGRGMEQCHGLTIHGMNDSWRCYTTIWEDAVAHAAAVDLSETTAENARRREMEQIPNTEITREKLNEVVSNQKPSVIETIEQEINAQSGAGRTPDSTMALEPPLYPEPAMEEAADPDAQWHDETTDPDAQWHGLPPFQTEGQSEPDNRPALIQPGQTPAAQEAWRDEAGIRPVPVQPEQQPQPDQKAPNQQSQQDQQPQPDKNAPNQKFRPDQFQVSSEASDQQLPPGTKAPDQPPQSDQKAPDQQPQPGQKSPSDQNMPDQQSQPDQKSSSGQNAQDQQLPPDQEAPGEAEKLWQHFQRHYPKIQAFDYSGGCEILIIKPQDIGLLPRETWNYGNNSFLLHGYYNYRYLILARLLTENGGARFLLGIPGHYYSNEKYMAAMFGFPNFVLSKMQPANDGRFGYWYTDIRLEH